MKINLWAPAKINLFLEIQNKRSDGYHNLESIMQTVSLYDNLSFENTGKDIFLSSSDKSLPTDETNIVYKAAKTVKDRFNINKGVKIYLTKEIPIGAGLGGGSSDAAATLKALIKLWNIKTTKKTLEQIAVKLGADVPFFLTGKTAICKGIGEIVMPLKNIDKLNIVLVNPGIKISTADIYKKVKFPLINRAEIHKIKSLICSGLFDTKNAFSSCFNRLEEFVLPNYPKLAKIKSVLNKLGCISLMSGSGSTIFGIFDSSTGVEAIKLGLNKYSWKTWFVSTADISL
jgi:4-diphosphocytidyl-2-C-methyl-D-erythritol kinase